MGKINKSMTKKQINKKKTSKKDLIIVLTAIGLIIAMPITFFIVCKKKISEKLNSKTETTEVLEPTQEDINELSAKALDEMGVKLEQDPTEKLEYANPTGDVKVENIVEDSNGTLWVDEEAKDKSEDIGKEVYDDQDGNLVIEPDGTVKNPEVDYEIKDEDGNIIDEGTFDEDTEKTPDGDPIPDGFDYNEDADKVVEDTPENENLFIDPEGNVWENEEAYKKYQENLKTDGETVETEVEIFDEPIYPTDISEPTEEPIIGSIEESSSQLESTTEPMIEETITEPTEPVTETVIESTEPVTESKEQMLEGVINQDGTYTIDGVTFLTKDDFYQCIMEPESYGMDIDGIIKPIAEIEKQNSLTK